MIIKKTNLINYENNSYSNKLNNLSTNEFCKMLLNESHNSKNNSFAIQMWKNEMADIITQKLNFIKIVS
jgi:hypothetical protein